MSSDVDVTTGIPNAKLSKRWHWASKQAISLLSFAFRPQETPLEIVYTRLAATKFGAGGWLGSNEVSPQTMHSLEARKASTPATHREEEVRQFRGRLTRQEKVELDRSGDRSNRDSGISIELRTNCANSH